MEQFRKPSYHEGVGWFIATSGSSFGYLHSDGVIRDSAIHNGELSGWFETEDLALRAIRNYGKTIIKQLEV